MIVLDTHTLVWWINGSNELSNRGREAIEGEQGKKDGLILVSSISAWEIAMLVDKGRLTLAMTLDDWLDTAGEIDGVRFVPVDNNLGVQSTRLPGDFHKDSADRMIVALARHFNVPLVTCDEKILNYRHVKTIW